MVREDLAVVGASSGFLDWKGQTVYNLVLRKVGRCVSNQPNRTGYLHDSPYNPPPGSVHLAECFSSPGFMISHNLRTHDPLQRT